MRTTADVGGASSDGGARTSRRCLTECQRDRARRFRCHRDPYVGGEPPGDGGPVRVGRPDRRRGRAREQRAALPRAGHRAAHLRPAREPGELRPPRTRRRRRSAGPRRPQPVAGALVQRPRRQPGGRARPRRAAQQPHRCGEPDHRGVRRPLPDDHRAQGARRLRLSGAPGGHRPVRSHHAAGDLAVDGQLRPRRHRHQPDHGQPRRGDPAGGHEPGALRLARRVVRQPHRRRDPHARHRVERQGDLRRLQRVAARSHQLRAQPVLRVRQPPGPSPRHRHRVRPRVRNGARPLSGPRAASSTSRRSRRPPGRPAPSRPATG